MNRLALLRYSILDACFSSPEGTPRDRMKRGGRTNAEPGGNTLMFKEDLLDLVNRRLQEAVPGTKPIAMRTLEKDLVDMQELYGVKIVKHSLHKRAWYSYASAGMSIRKGKLTGGELARLEGGLGVLGRFQETPGFEWLRFVDGRIRFEFGLVAPSKSRAAKSLGNRGQWVGGIQQGTTGEVWDTVLQALAAGSWAEVVAEEGPLHLRIEAVGEAGGELLLAGTVQTGPDQYERAVFDLAAVSRVQLLSEAPATAPASEAWAHPLRAVNASSVDPEDVGEAVELRIWFSGEALHGCDHRPFNAEPVGKPEAAAGGQILTYQLVPGPAWARRLWSFGPGAQLLEPLELRMQLAAQVEQMRAGYAKLFGP